MAIPSWFDAETGGPQSPQQPPQAPSPGGGAPGGMTPLSQVGRDPRFTSANAPRVQQNAQGQWTLTEHGNTRYLQPNEVQDATNYANQFWTDNPQGFQLNNPLTVGDAYQQFYGRAGTAQELARYGSNPRGPGSALNALIYSDEANRRRNAVTGGRETGPPPGMSMEAWLQGEAYLDRIDPGRRNRPFIPPGAPGSPEAARPTNEQLRQTQQQTGMSADAAAAGAPVPPGYVMLRAPTGQVRAVPYEQVQFYLSRGATWA